MAEPVALVIGAGDATGGAIARRFAKGGFTVCATRRHLEKLQPLIERIQAGGGRAHGFASDARQEEEVAALVEKIESQIGPIEVLVFNIGARNECGRPVHRPASLYTAPRLRGTVRAAVSRTSHEATP